MRKFDDDPTLTELLTPEQQQRLADLIGSLCGHPFEISAGPQPEASPIELNLETVGWVSGGESADQRGRVSALLSFLLVFVAKYRLAANLHHDVTEASYAALERQNQALKASEAKYRNLSDQLQEQVSQQVAVIEETQKKLYEAAQLRSVGHLAAGIAHEINNPIGFISSNLRVANDYVSGLEQAVDDTAENRELFEDFRDLIRESLDGASRITSIVSDLKTFSSIDQDNHSPCDINDLLRSAIHMTETAYGDRIKTVCQLGELPQIPGFPAKLSQTFFNLLDNAAQAILESGTGHETGKILIKTSVDLSGIHIVIQDNGCGIPEANQAQVFDAFFTTRPVGSGTGLGLSVARDTVRAHRGQIRLESREGIGTRFTLTIPTDT